MEFDPITKFVDDNFDDSISFREFVEKYLIHWKWFLLSVLTLGILAFTKLYYEVPQYSASAQILIKEKQKGGSITDLSSFDDLGIFGSDRSNLENEIYILSSRRLISKVVNELKLNISYYIENEPYNIEKYPDFPIVISFPRIKDTLDIEQKLFNKNRIDKLNVFFKIKILSNKRFKYIDSEDNIKGEYNFGEEFKSVFGEKIVLNINKNANKSYIGNTIIVMIFPTRIIADYYKNSIVIKAIDDKSDVLNISLKSNISEKSILIINNLIEQYNADALEDKSQIFNKTVNFLNDRIELLTNQLTAIETSAAQFKTQKGLVDVQSESGVFLQSSSINERELIEANTQLSLVEFMKIELNKNTSVDLLPSNIGLADPSIIALIGEFNTLVLQRNRILKSSTDRNPLILSLDSQLSVLKLNLVGSLNTLKSSMQIRLNSLRSQSNKINSKIASVPKNERLYKSIIRQQETKNVLYLFLLQKREESEISKSVNVENAKIIDFAYSNGRPVSPNKPLFYLASVLLGLIIPFVIISIKNMLDTKIHDENDIKNLKIPYLGDIPLTSKKKDLYISDSDNSNIAEAFRYIRTNINYMLDSKENGKTVFVTSTQSTEGKTFTAINLASSLAISGKKTLLLGMDLRAPKITKYIGLEDKLGVTNFIKNESISIDDIIETHTKFENLDVINSGDIPPNPVELLMSKRVEEIFEKVKYNYEYIVVDTAPVGMVTDTIQISKFADLTIYVVKANYLDKRMLHIPDKLHKEKKLANMAMLINGSDHSKGAYGYGYGYGNKKTKPWYMKILKTTIL